MRLRTMGVLAGLAAAMTLGAACGKGSGTTTIAGEKANDHGTKSVSGSTFELEADNGSNGFYFNPTVLKGTPGQRVTLEITNEGTVKHNFTVDSQKIDQDLKPGQTVKVAVTFPPSGQAEFHCEYHQSLGMVGALEASS